jgi:hypothetical protein
MPATATPLRKARTANSTASSFTAKIPTVTEPTHSDANGIYNLYDSGLGIGVDGRVPKRLLVIPFGGNSNDETFSMRVWGWSKTIGAAGTALWIPQLLAELAVTLGNISATAIEANMLMSDTVVVTYGITDEKTLGVSIMAPANDVPAAAWIDLRGCEKIEFDFDLTGTGDAANCFWRAVDGPH